jgi:hypothetical protein
MASVMFGGGANVPSIDTVRCHVRVLVRRDVDNDMGTWRGERDAVEIKNTVEAGVGRALGLAARRPKEIQCDVGLGHEEIPFGERELGVTGG